MKGHTHELKAPLSLRLKNQTFFDFIHIRFSPEIASRIFLATHICLLTEDMDASETDYRDLIDAHCYGTSSNF